MSAAALHCIQPVEPEFSTDAPPRAEDLAAAYFEFLPLTEGDKAAAATLAVGAVLAGVLERKAEGLPR